MWQGLQLHNLCVDEYLKTIAYQERISGFKAYLAEIANAGEYTAGQTQSVWRIPGMLPTQLSGLKFLAQPNTRTIMLTIYNFNSLKNDLGTWLGERLLEPILNIEGGWEYWIQIDFPAWLDTHYQTQYDFRREVTGILPNGRVDWLVNSQQDPLQHPPTAVEIKAQTHKYLQNTFVTDVATDVNKLATLGANYNKVMLVATIDGPTYNILIGQNFTEIGRYIDQVAFLWRTV